ISLPTRPHGFPPSGASVRPPSLRPMLFFCSAATAWRSSKAAAIGIISNAPCRWPCSSFGSAPPPTPGSMPHTLWRSRFPFGRGCMRCSAYTNCWSYTLPLPPSAPSRCAPPCSADQPANPTMHLARLLEGSVGAEPAPVIINAASAYAGGGATLALNFLRWLAQQPGAAVVLVPDLEPFRKVGQSAGFRAVFLPPFSMRGWARWQFDEQWLPRYCYRQRARLL